MIIIYSYKRDGDTVVTTLLFDILFNTGKVNLKNSKLCT